MSKQSGFSVFEILIVLTIFVLIIAVSNQTLFTSLKGQNKADATVNAKQNANYVASVMERALHSASSVSSCTSTVITYFDNLGAQQTFRCWNNQVLYSGAPLTNSNVSVSSCSFSCVQEGGAKTVLIDMTFEQTGLNLGIDQTANATIQTRIRLRN